MEGRKKKKKYQATSEEIIQEKNRLILLHRAVIKARWFYLVIYLAYGLSLMFFTRVMNLYAFRAENRPITQWLGTGLAILYNLAFYFRLKREKELTVKSLKWLSFFQVAGDLVFSTWMFYATGSLEGPGIVLLFFPLVISAILFSPFGVVITGFHIILFAGTIVLLEYYRLIAHIHLYEEDIAPKIFENKIAVFYTFFAIVAAIAGVAAYFGLTSRILRQVENALRQRTGELSNERDKVEAVVANLVDGLIFLDKESRIVSINSEAKSALGLKIGNIAGKKLEDLISAPYVDNLYNILGRKIEWTGQKYELIIGDPLVRYYDVLTSPVVAKDGQKIGLMIILHDITREKEVEHLKTEFVSIAAHQLRTPLSAIKWTLRMVLDGDTGPLQKEQAELLEGGYQSNERMIELVNDLLNVARIEEGRFIYDMSLFNVEELINKVISSLNPLAKKKNIILEYKKSKEPVPDIEADKEKIELTIQNFIENAIKYTPDNGQVTVSIKSDTINIELMVKDTGIGIPLQQQQRVFEKYFRAINAQKTGIEGTGMGLFICKSVIEKHGGRVWFESEENKGTTFWLTLPIKKLSKNK